MDLQEQAHWLTLLTDEAIDRTRSKRALYHWTVQQQHRLDELTEVEPAALRQALPELAIEQAAAWHQALSHAPDAETVLRTWQDQGVHLLTRADIAYPENLAERLPEQWLPYFIFFRGDPELLSRPGIYISGAEKPEEQAVGLTQELAQRLAPGPYALVGGFSQGIDRQALTAASQAQGYTVLVLPLGFGQAEPILRAGQQAVDQGRRLELSPFGLDAAYTPVLGNARTRLVTAMAEVLVLIAPDLPPEEWPGHEILAQHGGLILLWEQCDAELKKAWLDTGAQLFDDALSAEQIIIKHLGLASEEDVPPIEEEGPPGDPVAFEDAESAISLLSQTGDVPPDLARRLREAEETGKLGSDNDEREAP